MADYHPLIARAVEGLENSTGEARRGLYERARAALVAQLRSIDPPLSEADITRERLALEDAIRKVEAESMRKARAERPASAPPPRPAPPRPPVPPAAPVAPRRDRPSQTMGNPSPANPSPANPNAALGGISAPRLARSAPPWPEPQPSRMERDAAADETPAAPAV
ncbi:MAG: hypothetical protein WAK35_04300, partial [Xanthobacteraceae bacterium]